jgi:transcriptional regulator with XRE-family HTH domain
MALSTISKRRGHAVITSGARRALGSEIRRLRTAKGMTQSQLAHPFTRAYVCSVEHGRATPSLASLVWFARRLDVPVARLLDTLEEPVVRPATGGFTVS